MIRSYKDLKLAIINTMNDMGRCFIWFYASFACIEVSSEIALQPLILWRSYAGEEYFTMQWSWCITEAWNISDFSVSFVIRTLGARSYCRGLGTRRYPAPSMLSQQFFPRDRRESTYSVPLSSTLRLPPSHCHRMGCLWKQELPFP